MYQSGLVYLGKETLFDEQGNITKVIDHEKGYKICWAQAIEIVKQHIGNKYGDHDDISFILSRTNTNKSPNIQPRWSVGIYREEVEPTPYYRVDGITGKIVGKYKINATWY